MRPSSPPPANGFAGASALLDLVDEAHKCFDGKLVVSSAILSIVFLVRSLLICSAKTRHSSARWFGPLTLASEEQTVPVDAHLPGHLESSDLRPPAPRRAAGSIFDLSSGDHATR